MAQFAAMQRKFVEENPEAAQPPAEACRNVARLGAGGMGATAGGERAGACLTNMSRMAVL
jgi:hypothetical protein